MACLPDVLSETCWTVDFGMRVPRIECVRQEGNLSEMPLVRRWGFKPVPSIAWGGGHRCGFN